MRFLSVLLFLLCPLCAEPLVAKPPAASLKPTALKNFAKLPTPTQVLLTCALSLSERGLTYKYGSADPTAGGMDCSGAVYHVLQKCGYAAAPRQSDEMYAWTWRAGTFRAFNGRSMKSFEMTELHAGDLLFWTNSIGKTDRDPPVTHVMLYLGEQASDGRPVMFGSSDGRTYGGTARCGVGVFDFVLPKEASAARFIGYGHLPAKNSPLK